MTTPISRWANDAGFSLLELLVVLVIVGMTAGLAIAVAPQRRGAAALGEAADEAATFAITARRTSMAEGRSIAISADAGDRGLRGSDGTALGLPGFVVDVRPALPGAGRSISFFDDGSSDGGEIILRDASATATVSIDWLTGAVIAEAL